MKKYTRTFNREAYISRWSDKFTTSAVFAAQSDAKRRIIKKYLEDALAASAHAENDEYALDSLIWAALELELSVDQRKDLQSAWKKLKERQMEGGASSKYAPYRDQIKNLLKEKHRTKVIVRMVFELTGYAPHPNTISRWKREYRC